MSSKHIELSSSYLLRYVHKKRDSDHYEILVKSLTEIEMLRHNQKKFASALVLDKFQVGQYFCRTYAYTNLVPRVSHLSKVRDPGKEVVLTQVSTSLQRLRTARSLPRLVT